MEPHELIVMDVMEADRKKAVATVEDQEQSLQQELPAASAAVRGCLHVNAVVEAEAWPVMPVMEQEALLVPGAVAHFVMSARYAGEKVYVLPVVEQGFSKNLYKKLLQKQGGYPTPCFFYRITIVFSVRRCENKEKGVRLCYGI